MSRYRWPSVDDLVDLALDQADTSARVDTLLERVLLGATIAADTIERTWFLLGPGDFYDPVHSVIWSACLRLRAEHRVELAAVIEAVRHVPAAAQRVLEVFDHFTSGDDHITVVLKCAWAIRRASVQRAAAQRARAA